MQHARELDTTTVILFLGLVYTAGSIIFINYGSYAKMATVNVESRDFESAFTYASEKLRLSAEGFRTQQLLALTSFLRGEDVFVSL